MKLKSVVQRFLLPRPLISLIYFLRDGCRVSPRAEVDFNAKLRVGRGTEISSFCKVKASHATLHIGRNVSVACGTFLSANRGGIEIGDDCLIGPNCAIVAGNYVHDDLHAPFREQGLVGKGIRIGANVYLGAGAVVLDDTDIGTGVIVAPNSVVAGKVPDNVIVQGNPAKVVFKRR